MTKKKNFDLYPLLKATNSNNVDIVKLLIEYANNNNIILTINEKEKDSNEYPLFNAAEHNNLEIVQLLIDYANQKNIILGMEDNTAGKNPLSLAIAQNNIKMVELLFDYINKKDMKLELKENIIEIPDIKSSNGKYIYTDGIGTISIDLALKCVEKVGNNKFSYCSAFQIRLKGIKGVVAVDPKLGNKDIICIRPSMKKYESENNELGIIKASGYSTGYLNRQIISLLNDDSFTTNINKIKNY